MRADTRNWLESADYDLETAEQMMSSGRYLYVVFMCHLALEKVLKAAVAEATGEPAPRSHDLVHLARLSGILLDPDRQDFLGKLNDVSVTSRYPDDIRRALKEYDKLLGESYLEQTRRVIRWLKAHPLLAP